MSLKLKKAVGQIHEIAKKTVKAESLVKTAVVISRNPDGTLNVDDGQGGCTTVAPAANVRIGQTIRIGLAPDPGTVTNLPQENFGIDPSTEPCPDDPRDGTPKVIAVPAYALYGQQMSKRVHVGSWGDRLAGPADGASFNFGGGRVINDNFDAFPHSFPTSKRMTCSRSFFEFHTHGVLPPGATVRGIDFAVGFSPIALANFFTYGCDIDFAYMDSSHVSFWVLPSTAPDFPAGFPSGSADPSWWDLLTFSPGSALAEIRLDAVNRITLLPFRFPMDLFPTLDLIDERGYLKLAIVGDFDLFGGDPPTHANVLGDCPTWSLAVAPGNLLSNSIRLDFSYSLD